uniref:AAA family ATPase n=1 Tax=Agathobacter sp. TaxID=2021311 RepID=UPI0040579B2C
MGIYLNPSADGFEDILKDGLYVDKTGLITYTNHVMGTSRKLTCFSRPRRFGKSYAAQMLVAFYSKGADSGRLFENLRVANPPTETKKQETALYEQYLNNCDVLFWDMTWFISNAEKIENTVNDLQTSIIDDLRNEFPECIKKEKISMPEALLNISVKTGRKFFIIIDEWDALFREAMEHTDLQKSYIQLLRGLFKGGQVSRFLTGAYMTGILPIKKYGTQSALTDFREYTMLEPGKLAEYVGFTEKETQMLCDAHHLDFDEMCKWYDGYCFDRIGHVYSPNSVIKAVTEQKFSNYWTQTETYESLRIYIDLNFDGLKDAIIHMLGGNRCRIDAGSFQNDMTSIKNKDDVFTLLAHLGYLAYDNESKEVYIPNAEIRDEFIRAIKNGKRTELVKAIELSDRLLDATLRMDSDLVAEIIDEVHTANTSPKFYNNEQALRSVIIMAYLSCIDHYIRFEELAGGRGYIDILFLPNKTSTKPALLIELKWDKSADNALSQIENKNYAHFTKQFGYNGDVLMVGINYRAKIQKHTCVIKKYHPGCTDSPC